MLGLAFLAVGIEAATDGLLAGQALGVTTEEDVDASAGHVGGHRHRVEATRLGDDVGFSGVVLGVQDLVGDAPLLEQPGQHLGLFDRRSTHEHGLALLVALGDIFHHGAELAGLGPVDQVGLVETDHRRWVGMGTTGSP